MYEISGMKSELKVAYKTRSRNIQKPNVIFRETDIELIPAAC
jgi:hypothetical protein